MAALKGSKTEQNLRDAFAGESQANRRYLYFANKADIEGQNDVAALFRSTAEGETGHAHGHLEFLEQVGDPATGLPIGATRLNLKAAVAGETHEYTDMYPGEDRALGRPRRDRRLVRDAREGGALARQPLPEGPGRARRLTRCFARPASGGVGCRSRRRPLGGCRAAVSGFRGFGPGFVPAAVTHVATRLAPTEPRPPGRR